jgi:hypothetical protein
MDFTWRITYKGGKETVWQNGFEKLSLVLEEISDKDYKSSLMIEFFKEKIDLVASLSEGDTIKAYLNPRAKEYNGRWYNSISCRKVDVISQWNGGGSNNNASYDDNDDLPF